MPHETERFGVRVFGRWTQIVFLVAAFIAVIVTLIAISGVGPITPISRSMVWLLLINLCLVGIVAFYVGREYFQIRISQTRSGGSSLARRFTLLFSFGAIAPAVFVAVFLGTSINNGIENWFSERIKGIIENSAQVSQSNLQAIAEDIRQDTAIMAIDLNRAVVGFDTEPQIFKRFLTEQASFRDFTGALIVSDDGRVLLSTDTTTENSFETPAVDMYFSADQGNVAINLSETTSIFWALFKLADFDKAYLYTVRPISPTLLESLIKTEDTLSSYRKAEEQSRRLQIIFLLGFTQITALILLFFIRYGLWASNQITSPIARLAIAADEVRRGDLGVQVDLPKQETEVTDLTLSFNAMTTQIRNQSEAIDQGRREAEERRKLIETVLNGVSAGVVRVDEQLKVTLSNPSAGIMFPELDSDGQISLSQLNENFADLAQQAMQSDEIKSTTIVQQDSAIERHFLVKAAPVHGADNGCVITFDDTTRLISAQRQLAWRDVARRIAHEIRNPLTPIQLSAERLRRRYGRLIPEDDTVFQKCVETITRQVSDIGRMVEEFSSFARMPKPVLASFDLVGLVRNSVFSSKLSKPGIDYTFNSDISNLSLHGDERLIGQALTNLLKNAGEAVERAKSECNSSKPSASVHVSLKHVDDAAFLDIEDTGPGFPEKDRYRFLEPYFTTRDEGVGLGLAIVNRIVEDHGGQLTLLDRVDGQRGARVSIQLPLSGPGDDKVSSWSMSEEITNDT